MRRTCQRAIQTTCAHAAQPFHAGRAVFAALQIRSITTSTIRRKDEDKKDDVKIRWFEQTGPGRDSIKPIQDEDPGDFDAIERDTNDIFTIDKELEELGISRGNIGLEDLESHEGLPQSLRKGLQTLKDDEVVDMNSLNAHYQMPKIMKRYIQRFNTALRRSGNQPQDLQSRRELWATYLRCSHMPGFLDQVTDQAWKVLWRSQSGQPFFNEQAGHLLRLADDMKKVGIPLTAAQKLTRIKALEAAGQVDKALTQWHKARSELEVDDSVRHEFAVLGVTLECASGRPQRAQDIAFAVVRQQYQNRSAVRLLIPVIVEWAKKGSEEDIKQAWLLYLLVRRTLGQAESAQDSIDTEDFDQVYLGFLEAGRKDLAVNVFKDLIVAGQQSVHDSMRLYSSYNQVLDDLHVDARSSEQISAMSLEVLSKLPRRFENKFFYASWMKRLIGMGQVNAALQVTELMYERGVSPDAKHVNGIIGSWLRDGTAENQKLALELAWTMVDERMKLIARRHQTKDSTAPPRPDMLDGMYLPVHLRRRVPAATTETLCLLLLYYSRKSLSADMERVEALLSAAELRPNSYFMNHLMYYHSTQGKWVEVWQLFNKMSRQVRPDMASFACLWDCAHALTRRYEQMDKFPAPRRLFSTMMNWFSQLPASARKSAQEDFGAALYSRIVQAFTQFKDNQGLLVALYAMRDSFNLYPNEETIHAVTMQVAQMNEPRPAGHPQGRSRVRRKKAAGMGLQRNIEKAANVLQMVLANRSTELEQRGISVDKLDPEQRGQESLFVLAEFLRAAQRNTIDLDSEESHGLSEEFDKVAWEMAAGPFMMGPPVYNT